MKMNNVMVIFQGDGPLEKTKKHANFSTQCLVLTKRSFINMHRDLGYYWLRLAIYLALSLGIGTLFYNVGSSYKSIQVKTVYPDLVNNKPLESM